MRLAASAMPVAIPGPKATAAIARAREAGRAVHIRDRARVTRVDGNAARAACCYRSSLYGTEETTTEGSNRNAPFSVSGVWLCIAECQNLTTTNSGITMVT